MKSDRAGKANVGEVGHLSLDGTMSRKETGWQWRLLEDKPPKGLPRWLIGKVSACQAGDGGLIPGSGRSPGEGNGNPFQYSCLGNSMDRGAWWATVHGVTKSWTRLNTQTSKERQRSKCGGP